MTIHYYIHVYCIPAIIILILIIISPSTFAVAQILNPVIKFGILTTPHHVCIPVIIIPILPTYHYFHHPHYHYHYHHHYQKNHLYLQSPLLFYILVSWKTYDWFKQDWWMEGSFCKRTLRKMDSRFWSKDHHRQHHCGHQHNHHRGYHYHHYFILTILSPQIIISIIARIITRSEHIMFDKCWQYRGEAPIQQNENVFCLYYRVSRGKITIRDGGSTAL